MNTTPPFDLLAEVRRYVASATPEDIQRDMVSSDFEAYRGIGEPIGREHPVVCGEVHFDTMHLLGSADLPDMSALLSSPPPAISSVGSKIDLRSLQGASSAGKTEEMPLAA